MGNLEIESQTFGKDLRARELKEPRKSPLIYVTYKGTKEHQEWWTTTEYSVLPIHGWGESIDETPGIRTEGGGYQQGLDNTWNSVLSWD